MTYEFVEKPIRFGQLSKYRRTVPAGLAACLVCFAALGTVTFLSGGFLSRLPKELQNLASYKYDFAKEYRVGICLLGPDQDATSFAADCSNPADSHTRPLFLLWGDSHAGALYPGFKPFKGSEGISLGQLTTSSCPPYINYDAPNRPPCRPINDSVLKKIVGLKPKVVFLHGSWAFYGEDANRKRLAETTKLLKEAGVEEIVLIGPVPIWNPSLPKAIFETYQNSWPHRTPARMTNVATETVRQTDKIMRDIAAKNNIVYFSAFDALCNAEGCLTFFEGAPTAWDSAHLTEAGARVVVGELFKQLNLLKK